MIAAEIGPLALLLLAAWGMWRWARWLGDNWRRWARHLGWAFPVIWIVTSAMTVRGLVGAFGAVSGESVDPSQKARVLAESISEAMSWTAFGFGLDALLLLALGAMTLHHLATRRRAAAPEGEGPYR